MFFLHCIYIYIFMNKNELCKNNLNVCKNVNLATKNDYVLNIAFYTNIHDLVF